MSKTIVKLHTNWRQVGTTIDREGAGEDYDRYVVGKSDVIFIEECKPTTNGDVWNYLIHFETGRLLRVFNPNYVEYSNEVDS